MGELPGEHSILIVDDETDVTEIVALWLRREGFRVLVASEAAEGLAVASAEHPDAILLDVMMPGISGWEMLERLKASSDTSGIHVVMLTVVAEPSVLRRAADLGAAGYIRKPFHPGEIVRTVRSVLDGGMKYA